MKIGNKYFDPGKTHVVGILNTTPDSFSDGGNFDKPERALRHVEEMIAGGAEIIDVGGESTRPGFTPVDAQEEIERTAPVIERIKKEFDTVVSIDTVKSEVALEAVRAGADLINDVTGLLWDEEMAEVVAQSGAAVCITHNSHFFEKSEGTLAEQIGECIDKALKAGIAKDRLILDPGIGFKGSYERDMEVLADEGLCLPKGYPVLLGVSRKSVIGKTLELEAGQRLYGTLAVTALAVMRRIPFIRVHDVAENVQVIKMLEAVKSYER